jgi:hypothetical protein
MRIEVTVRRFWLLYLTLAVVRASGATLYVGAQGNDSNPGTATQPFRTITRAYSLAGPGTTILVTPGVYSDYTSGWGLHLGKSGTASSPIVLRSQVRGGAVIDGQNASDRNVAIYLDGSYNIIDGFDIRGGPLGGITIWGNDNQILNNDIHHNGTPPSASAFGQDGIYSSENTHDTVYQANYIHDNGRTGSNLDHALYLCGDNEVVINNVLVRNAAYGLHIAGYTTVSNMKVYNNVMAYNGKSGIILWMAVSGVDIKNNIIYGNGRFGLDSYDAHGSGVTLDRNLVFGNGSGNYNFINGASDYTYTLGTTISSAPLFVNSTSAGFDAHLGAGSPAINTGLNLSSVFPADIDGATRPLLGAWDLGAYRYGAVDTTPPTVSIISPANNVTVFGSAVVISANAADNVGVAGVQFKLDGANLGTEDTSAPYSVTWNTMAIANGPHTLSAVARDAAGNQATANTVSVTVNNVNTAPTISSIGNQTTALNTATASLAFTVSDAETAASSLTVSGNSSNPTLVPTSNIVFGGAGSSRTVKVAPATNQTGTATITLTVSDGALSRTTSFVLTVNSSPSSGLITVTVAANDANASRVGPDNGAITITRSGSTTSALTVNYSLGGTAVNGTDYNSLGASVTIPAGASSAVITIVPKSVASYVGSKTVTLTLSANAAYTIGPANSGTVTIAGNNVPATSLRKAPANGGMVITWSSQAGKIYRVAYKINLTDPWVDLSGSITAPGSSTSWTDNTAGASKQRFYAVYVTN